MTKKKILIVIILIVCAIFATNVISDSIPCGSVCAASKKKETNKKAMKAYKKMLKSVSYDEFSLADINYDGIKELFICDEDKLISDQLYVYKAGKVIKVDDYNWSWDVDYYPNKKYIYAERVGIFDDDKGYYRLNSKGKIIELARKTGHVTFDGDRKVKYTYTLKGKKVTKKKYNAYVKKLKKNAKKLKLNYYKNTSDNRGRYLKG